MSELKPLSHFLNDTEEFLEKLNALFLLFEAGSVSRDSLQEAFRSFHSIKSEAAYLNFEDISAMAHSGEEILNQMQKSGKKPEPGILDRLFTITSGIESKIKHISLPQEEAPATESGTGVASYRPAETPGIGFSAYERELLKEARDRNEHLYRVVCRFIEGLPMTYPRAFLILNNLEQLVTVIKTTPDLYQKQDDFDSLTVYFTSGAVDQHTREIFNVDGIEKAYFARIPWELILKGKAREKEKEPARTSLKNVNVPVEQIDGMLGDLHSLKMKLFQELPQYRHDLEDVENRLKSFRLVSLDTEFNRFIVFVRNTSRDLEKEAGFTHSGGNIQLDKNILDQLSDPLMQLVRNALVHGIELPEERIAAGKPSQGAISISAEQQGKGLLIKVCDDGRGVDEARIRDLARKTGLFTVPVQDISLLDLLATQGFSSAPQISGYAGRGIGLDVVVQKIRAIQGAVFSLENSPGEGVCFSIFIPYAVSLVSIHLFSYSGQLFGLFSDNLSLPERMESKHISKGPEEDVLYDGKPVYTIYGKLILMERLPETGVVIPVTLNGEKAVLLADDDVSVEDLPYDQLYILETQMPHLFDVHIGSRKVPYLIYKPGK